LRTVTKLVKATIFHQRFKLSNSPGMVMPVFEEQTDEPYSVVFTLSGFATLPSQLASSFKT
jgi:hypothetical protein